MTKDIDNTVNQSNLEVTAHSLHKARENECERAAIGSGFTPDRMKSGASFF